MEQDRSHPSTLAPRVSGLVHVLNEERALARCLDGLTWCDEVLVIDSFSTDRTEEIARSYPNVRFLEHEYHGAASQKNWAIPQCRNEWVFVLDADEVCTPGLRDEMLTRIAAPGAPDGFVIRRTVYFLGKRIRFCGWRRDRVTRLMRRDAVRYEDKRVHARVRLLSDGSRGLDRFPTLEERMPHHMVESLSEYAERSMRYGRWAAATLWRKGKRTRVTELILGPAWRFFRSYVLMGGFLDGAHGLAFCSCQTLAVFTKWATLWGWQRDVARGREPDLPSFDDDEATWSAPEAKHDGAAMASASERA
jgi:glycosyltransferase involved in cell wall biosynthesis